MLCNQCNKSTPENSIYCRNCGSKLITDAKTEIQPIKEEKIGYFKRLFYGRIDRKNYLIGWIVFYLFLLLLIFIFGIVFTLITDFVGIKNSELANNLALFWFYLFALIYSSSLITRRAHDFGKNWEYVFWSFIPIINFYFGLELLLKKGDEQNNRFGKTPKGGLKFLKILGLK